MPCGSVRIRMSSSSTTTSDIRRSPKPPNSRVDPGVFALLGGSIGPIPQGIRSRYRLMPIRESAQPRSGRKPSVRLDRSG